MTYYDSAEGEEITQLRAMKEVINHGCDWYEFLADVGDRYMYDAQEVLDWLGY